MSEIGLIVIDIMLGIVLVSIIFCEYLNKKTLIENYKLKKIIAKAYSEKDILNLYNKNECNINALNYINRKTNKNGELVLLSDEKKELNEILKGE